MSISTIKSSGRRISVPARKACCGTNLTTINVKKPKKVAAKKAAKPPTKTGGPNSMVKRRAPKRSLKLCNKSRTIK